jgi:tetratricopeptide (TPR) repeat protein
MEHLLLQLTALVAGICALWLAQKSLSRKKRPLDPSTKKKKAQARRRYAKGVQLLAKSFSSAEEARALAMEAAAEADAALALDPSNAPAFHVLKALALERQGLLQGAIRSLDSAIDPSPPPPMEETIQVLSASELSDALAKRASLRLSARKNMDAAIADLRRSLDLTPGNPEVLCTLGLCYEKTKRFADAEKAYQRAFALDPKSEEAWAGLKRLRP